MSLSSELSSSAQTAYAQLFDATLASEVSSTVSNIQGSFSRKQIRSRDYWYFQYSDLSGRLRQVYLGPDSDSVRALVELGKQPKEKPLIPLARSALALGCTAIQPKHFRVIRRLSEYGFFRAGGVLVGTHAFLCYGNMLGQRWGDSSRTQDVDFAHAGKNLSIALPSNIAINTHAAIDSLQMGLLPISGASGEAAATYLNPRDPDFRLDFLTTLHRGKAEAFVHPQLGIPLQPLKFMEYALENLVQAVVFCAQGSVVVNLPHPARYAMHKLLIYGERAGTYLQKARKDLMQAGALVEALAATRDWELQEAWDDLSHRGRSWAAKARRGCRALNQVDPATAILQFCR